MKVNFIKSYTKKFLLVITIITVALLSYPHGYFVLQEGSSPPKDYNKSTEYHGVKAYIINLDRSKARLKYIEPKVQNLGYAVERVSAIDGSLLSKDELNKVVDFEKYEVFLGDLPKLGTIGCSLSHIKAWQLFLQSDYEFALIFEDDVDFDHNKLSSVANLLTRNPDLWDINSFEIQHKGSPLDLKKFPEADVYLVTYLTEVTHAGAYMMSRNAARVLISKALPILMPIDHYFTRSWEFGLKFTGIEPRLVFQKFGDSVINSSSRYKLNNENNERKLNVSRWIFKLQSYFIRLIYNLNIYLCAIVF